MSLRTVEASRWHGCRRLLRQAWLTVPVNNHCMDAPVVCRPIAPGKDASPPPPWDPWIPGAFFMR
jgi:hypothetical protein